MSISGNRLEIIELGGELGFILPDDLVSAWNLSEGEILTATAIEGGFLFVPEQPSKAQPGIR
jgi:hypothetical protein